MAKLAKIHNQLVIGGATLKQESTYDGLDTEDSGFVKGNVFLIALYELLIGSGLGDVEVC